MLRPHKTKDLGSNPRWSTNFIMKNQHVTELLQKIEAIHDKKNEDYSGGGLYENFERAAQLIAWFEKNEDKAFVNHIATKLARLSTLLNNSQRAPNNESIQDSFLDLATYCVLWACYHQSRSYK